MRTSTHRIALAVTACGLMALSAACPAARAHPRPGPPAAAHRHAPGGPRTADVRTTDTRTTGTRDTDPRDRTAGTGARATAERGATGAGAFVPALAGALAGDEPLASGTGRAVTPVAPGAAGSATLTRGPGRAVAVNGVRPTGRTGGTAAVERVAATAAFAPAPGVARPVPTV